MCSDLAPRNPAESRFPARIRVTLRYTMPNKRGAGPGVFTGPLRHHYEVLMREDRTSGELGENDGIVAPFPVAIGEQLAVADEDAVIGLDFSAGIQGSFRQGPNRKRLEHLLTEDDDVAVFEVHDLVGRLLERSVEPESIGPGFPKQPILAFASAQDVVAIPAVEGVITRGALDL